MKLSRREALVALGGATVLTGCANIAGRGRDLTRQPLAPIKKSDDQAVAVLNRFGFGPSPADLAAVREVGVETWFEKQLEPTEEEPAHLDYMIGRLDISQFGPYDLRDWKEDAIVAQLQQAALLRAVYSPWQVRERMCDFWTNHFNIYAKKGLAAYRKPMDEREVVRKNSLGKFPDMVRASAESSAMLVYLDQQNSSLNRPNENYARELMELHTLGVHGGYSQNDVMEVARCFTGWTEERRFMRKKGAFRFRPEFHDDGAKSVLGQQIPANGGVKDGHKVIDIVTSHPSTAKFLARKLCRYFFGDGGSAYESAVAESYSESGGDIKAMVRTLFKSFLRDESAVVKRPFDYVASALRATDATTDGAQPVLEHMAKMGQPLYLWPMPDGYPVDTASWTGSMLARWNFAVALTGNQIKGTRVDLDLLTQKLSGAKVPQAMMASVAGSSEVERLSGIIDGLPIAEQAAVCLASPEFQWK